MLCIYEAYARPMVIHVRLLEAILRSFSSHVELLLSQERRVPFKPLPGPSGTRRFWMMSAAEARPRIAKASYRLHLTRRGITGLRAYARQLAGPT